MIIAIYQFYCVQGRVAIPVNRSCYYNIVVRQEKVIPIAKLYGNSDSHNLGSIVVSVMDSQSCDRGSSPGQGKHIYVML